MCVYVYSVCVCVGMCDGVMVCVLLCVLVCLCVCFLPYYKLSGPITQLSYKLGS